MVTYTIPDRDKSNAYIFVIKNSLTYERAP